MIPARSSPGVARTIGPLVKYYRSTGHAAALELALLLKEKAIGRYFTEDGSYDRELFGTHAHSVTCTMSSPGTARRPDR